MATSTTTAIAADASRENQNSSAIGASRRGRRARVGSTSVRAGVSPSTSSSTVTIPSTIATANPPTSVLNSRRACVRASGPGPRRTRRGSTTSPTAGTRKPKNNTQLVVCGSSAVPSPTSRNVTVPTTASAPRAGRAPGSPSHDGLGNSSSARMYAAQAMLCSTTWCSSVTTSPVAVSIARAAAWACRLNAPADPTSATARSRIGQVRMLGRRTPAPSRTTASTRFSRLNP